MIGAREGGFLFVVVFAAGDDFEVEPFI